MPRDNDSVNSDNEGAPKSTYEIYRAEADSLLRNDEFKKASRSYTKALDLRPGDRHCLVSRSRCYLRMDQTEEALKDVEESLKEDRDYYKGVLQKAEVLYFKGDFETALVYYHRGNKLRPELTEFRLGIQKAEEAINNSVGDSSIVLTCDGDLSYFYQHQETEKGKKAKKPRGGYSKHKQVQEKKRVERKKSSMDSKTQKKLLGQLYHDVTFLNNMIKDEKHTAHKTQNSEEINTLAIEALNFLESRTEFWQQQSPARTNKGQDRKESGKDRGNVQPARYVLNSLEEIDRKQTSGHCEAALKQARQVMKHVDGWTDNDLSNKQEVLANLHSIIGNCHLDLGNVDKALQNHEKDLQIGKENDLQDAVSRAMDNLGRCHAKKGNYEEAIEIWSEKVPTSQSGLESAWLLHEIGRCYLEIGKFADSKKRGEESLKHAQEIGDNSWMLNASVLIAQSEVKLKDYQGAIDTFERALDYAEVMNNKDAQAAIKKAIADVNHQIVQNENNADIAEERGESDKEDDHAPVNNANAEHLSDDDDEKKSARSKSPSDLPSERSKASSHPSEDKKEETKEEEEEREEAAAEEGTAKAEEEEQPKSSEETNADQV